MTNKNFIKDLSSKYFRISFMKKDGTIREICARIPKEKHSNPDYLLVWDNKDQCLKTVIKDNIILIKQGSRFWR